MPKHIFEPSPTLPTSDGKVDTAKLLHELTKDPGPSLQVAGVDWQNGYVIVDSGATRAEVAAVIASHVGAVVPVAPLAIAEFMSSTRAHWRSVDFGIGLTIKPLKVPTKHVRWEITEFIHYAEYDENGGGLGKPLVRETFVYHRDATGVLTHRVHTIEWYLTDGTLHPDKKVITKPYNRRTALKADRKRREANRDDITNETMGYVAGLLTEPPTIPERVNMGRLWANGDAVRSALDAYVSIGAPDILTVLASDPATWLDTPVPNRVKPGGGNPTIREWAINAFDLWSGAPVFASV